MPIHCPNFPRKYQNIPRKQYQQPHRRHDVCISHASSAPSSSKLLSLVLLTPFSFFLFLPSLTLNYLRKLTNRREVNSDCSTVQLAQCSPSTHVSVRRILAPRVANLPCCSHTSVHLLLLLWNPCNRQTQNGLKKDGCFFFHRLALSLSVGLFRVTLSACSFSLSFEDFSKVEISGLTLVLRFLNCFWKIHLLTFCCIIIISYIEGRYKK